MVTGLATDNADGGHQGASSISCIALCSRLLRRTESVDVIIIFIPYFSQIMERRYRVPEGIREFRLSSNIARFANSIRRSAMADLTKQDEKAM